MHRSRIALAALAFAAAGAIGAYAQSVGSSAANYSNNLGWHIGGLLEILPSGTFRLGTGSKTATAVAGAATLNNLSGVVTSEPLTTAAGTNYTLTITDPAILPTDMAFGSVALGTATTGTPEISTVTPGAGTLTIVVRNATGAPVLNGTVGGHLRPRSEAERPGA